MSIAAKVNDRSDEDLILEMKARVLFPLARSDKAMPWRMLDRWCDAAYLVKDDRSVVAGGLPGVVEQLKHQGAVIVEEDPHVVRITDLGRSLLDQLRSQGYDGDTRVK